MNTEWLGWWFSPADERLPNGDGREIKVGVTHTVEGPPVLCEHGLHAAPSLRDALVYAPSNILWRVRLGGQIKHGDDKSCATERTYLARVDAKPILREFARRCALSVIHLWDAPDIVREYLETGDETLRDAAWDAAMTAAWPDAWDAVKTAAMAIVWDSPAWGAAKAAASYAAVAGASDAKLRQTLDEMALAAIADQSAGV